MMLVPGKIKLAEDNGILFQGKGSKRALHVIAGLESYAVLGMSRQPERCDPWFLHYFYDFRFQSRSLTGLADP